MSKTQSERLRKRERPGNVVSSDVESALIVCDENGNPHPAFPLVAYFWDARERTSLRYGVVLVLLVIGLFKWATGLWPYSGFQSPPMYGDFEAQRHWMEITLHLPVSQWYFHDLQWWGLDYPPLTAYHSWLLGYLGSLFDPKWFYLHSSRGLEDPLLKVFMRATVIISEILTYVPSAIAAIVSYSQERNASTLETLVVLTAFLMQPCTILIDNGHFQYNTVMLGFSLASIVCMRKGRTSWASVFFVAALGFKQMALFYAPAVFAFLLGSCLWPRPDLNRLIRIVTVTASSFVALFLPLVVLSLSSNASNTYPDLPVPEIMKRLPLQIEKESALYPPILQLSQAIHRIFPFARGLFEDKVANFWCALNTFYKLRSFDGAFLQRAALTGTSLSILPPFVIVLCRPRKEVLVWGLAATAWGFFLFSYQVHEKNVLLPLLPTTLLLGSKPGLQPLMRAWIGFANTLGSWTLFPLLERENLRMPYAVLTLFWAYLLGLPPASTAVFTNQKNDNLSFVVKAVHLLFYIAMGSWHLLNAFVATPEKKPDLWVVLNVLVGTSGFGVIYLWCLYNLVIESEILSSMYRDKRYAAKDRKKKTS